MLTVQQKLAAIRAKRLAKDDLQLAPPPANATPPDSHPATPQVTPAKRNPQRDAGSVEPNRDRLQFAGRHVPSPGKRLKLDPRAARMLWRKQQVDRARRIVANEVMRSDSYANMTAQIPDEEKVEYKPIRREGDMDGDAANGCDEGNSDDADDDAEDPDDDAEDIGNGQDAAEQDEEERALESAQREDAWPDDNTVRIDGHELSNSLPPSDAPRLTDEDEAQQPHNGDPADECALHRLQTTAAAIETADDRTREPDSNAPDKPVENCTTSVVSTDARDTDAASCDANGTGSKKDARDTDVARRDSVGTDVKKNMPIESIRLECSPQKVNTVSDVETPRKTPRSRDFFSRFRTKATSRANTEETTATDDHDRPRKLFEDEVEEEAQPSKFFEQEAEEVESTSGHEDADRNENYFADGGDDGPDVIVADDPELQKSVDVSGMAKFHREWEREKEKAEIAVAAAGNRQIVNDVDEAVDAKELLQKAAEDAEIDGSVQGDGDGEHVVSEDSLPTITEKERHRKKADNYMEAMFRRDDSLQNAVENDLQEDGNEQEEFSELRQKAKALWKARQKFKLQLDQEDENSLSHFDLFADGEKKRTESIRRNIENTCRPAPVKSEDAVAKKHVDDVLGTKRPKQEEARPRWMQEKACLAQKEKRRQGAVAVSSWSFQQYGTQAEAKGKSNKIRTRPRLGASYVARKQKSKNTAPLRLEPSPSTTTPTRKPTRTASKSAKGLLSLLGGQAEVETS